ncbi:STAS domain-containing protein [Dechloromonas agitata]|uniref:Anti-sigma factor antagonist n=1 Tax=Dechloromonas agitata TaxID=73030 RepID=A0A930BTK9_9RHOO|nr:STAS domain-containing protein [Dechloromonas agitata]MBF1164547.1 STAS domain-containing protein [Dechloromonas agitata]MDE1546247.1 STAS domain-containing protein [Dechloromonas agitata]
MEIQTAVLNATATLRLKGRFQFDSHREFRTAYEPYIADPAVRTVVLDFSGVDYLDSAALGMLLLLREKLGNVRKEVELTGTHGMVKQVLEIANFARLFRIA